MNELKPALVSELRADVDSICLPNGRMVGSPGHRTVRELLSRRLREIGGEPWWGDAFELPYSHGGQSFCNLIGVVRGRNPRLAPLLVGAHYDSIIAAPCADDNAAAVAIALVVGRHLAETRPLERDLVIALFDAEEPPYFCSPAMGSVRFWEDQRDGRPIHAALIMDLVGHDVIINGVGSETPASLASSLAPMLFVTGTESHQALRSVLDRAGAVEKLPLVPTLNRYVGDMSDHGVFRQNGVPYLFLSCGRWPHYHLPSDTPDRLNYDKMERITRQVLGFAHTLDSAELPQTGSERFAETLDVEITRMRHAFGAWWEPVLELCGLRAVTSRTEMDRLVAMFLNFGV
jgi:Peptidase family M28